MIKFFSFSIYIIYLSKWFSYINISMKSMTVVKNFLSLKKNVADICKKINRDPDEINIVAVSKGQDKKKIKDLISFSHFCYGENRLEETEKKWSFIKNNNIKLHYIGALQSKKVKKLAPLYDVIETLDSESSAKEFANFFLSKKISLNFPEIYIQINIAREPQKRGVMPENFNNFLTLCKTKYNLKIKGAMCMAPYGKDPEKYFNDMKNLCKINLIKNISMGMSNDYQKAIFHGSNNIRIGSKIFENEDG